MVGLHTKPEECFPPSANLHPIFWGFHLTNWNHTWDHISKPVCVEYLKKHEPIGCRDSYTTEKLAALGVKTFYSKCLTLTLPKREHEPENGWNIVADMAIPLPSFIKDEALYVSHVINHQSKEELKFHQAQKLLNLYRDQAKLVITSRVHCALPCIAMGIPVIFIGNAQDYRLSIVRDAGMPIYHFNKKEFNDLQSNEEKRKMMEILWTTIDWNGHLVDFEDQKIDLIKNFQNHIRVKMHDFL